MESKMIGWQLMMPSVNQSGRTPRGYSLPNTVQLKNALVQHWAASCDRGRYFIKHLVLAGQIDPGWAVSKNAIVGSNIGLTHLAKYAKPMWFQCCVSVADGGPTLKNIGLTSSVCCEMKETTACHQNWHMHYQEQQYRQQQPQHN